MAEQPDDIYLGVERPFNLQFTVWALQRRPNSRVDIWEGNRYHRALSTRNGDRLAIVETARPTDPTRLKLSIAGGAVSVDGAEDIAGQIRHMLGLNVDLAPFYKAAGGDPQLREPLARLCGLRPPRFSTLFETFANTVIFQQISLAAGIAIHGRLVERFGHKVFHDNRTYYVFPDPYDIARTSGEELRHLGLSIRKADVLRDLASRSISGELEAMDLGKLSSETAIERLTKLHGLGRWSAELILLRGLGRLDVFPGGDSGARKNMAKLIGVQGSLGPAEEQVILERYGQRKGFLYFCALVGGGMQAGIFPSSPPASGCLS